MKLREWRHDRHPDEAMTEAFETMNAGTGLVVFFDGVCGLCNGFVDFLLARDHNAILRFSPLQGETYRSRYQETAKSASGVETELRTVVFCDATGIHRKSEAVLRALEALGGVWAAARILRIVPRPLRDRIYDQLARRRYRWFGKRDTCRVPGPGERNRFLP